MTYVVDGDVARFDAIMAGRCDAMCLGCSIAACRATRAVPPNFWSRPRSFPSQIEGVCGSSSGVVLCSCIHIMARRRSKKGGRTSTSNTYSNVHEMKTTELFQAWTPVVCTGKARGPYVGAHKTKRLAARAQDRALLKLRKSAERELEVKLNFPEEDYVGDARLREVLTDKEFFELLRGESRAKYKRVEPTKCLKRFLEEERCLKPEPKGKKARMPLADFLFELLMERKDELTPLTKSTAPSPRTHSSSQASSAQSTMTYDGNHQQY